MPRIGSAGGAETAGAIESDLPCHSCGYNLRGLSLDGRCPECNLEVATSARGDLLRYADPTWMRKLADGAEYMVWGAAAMVAGLVLIPVGGLIVLYSVWLITAPEPNVMIEGGGKTRRAVVRTGFAVSASVFGVAIALLLTDVLALGAFLQAAFLANAATLAGWAALASHVVRLAERVPSVALASRLRVLGWLIVTILLAVAAVLAVEMIVRAAHPPVTSALRALSGARRLLLPVAAMLVVVSAIFFRYLLRLAKLLRDEAEAADKNAVAGAPPPPPVRP